MLTVPKALWDNVVANAGGQTTVYFADILLGTCCSKPRYTVCLTRSYCTAMLINILTLFQLVQLSSLLLFRQLDAIWSTHLRLERLELL